MQISRNIVNEPKSNN